MILAIPLSCRLPSDKLIWHYDAKGLFYVKSAYKVAFNRRFEALSSQSLSRGVSVWNFIWKENIPGKVKMCTWKACQDILPTRSNLITKGVGVDNICLFCSSSLELALHVFRDCSFASEVYVYSQLCMDSRLLGQGSMCDWLALCVEFLPKTRIELLFMILHEIWRARNLLLWENKVSRPSLVSQFAKLQLQEFMLVKPVHVSHPLQVPSR